MARSSVTRVSKGHISQAAGAASPADMLWALLVLHRAPYAVEWCHFAVQFATHALMAVVRGLVVVSQVRGGGLGLGTQGHISGGLVWTTCLGGVGLGLAGIG